VTTTTTTTMTTEQEVAVRPKRDRSAQLCVRCGGDGTSVQAHESCTVKGKATETVWCRCAAFLAAFEPKLGYIHMY
jgi:hypothetical protein